MQKTVESVLNNIANCHNQENSALKIVSIESICPLSNTVVSEGKNEMFVKMIIETDDLYKVGHLAIDWIDDAESGQRYSDAIPEEKKKELFLKVPMATQMLPHITEYSKEHKDEFSQLPPWGIMGAYENNCLEKYVPFKTKVRVQCYNNVFYRPKSKERDEVVFFMFRMPRLTTATPKK